MSYVLIKSWRTGVVSAPQFSAFLKFYSPVSEIISKQAKTRDEHTHTWPHNENGSFGSHSRPLSCHVQENRFRRQSVLV